MKDNGKLALDFDGSNDGFYSSGVSVAGSMDVFILSHKESTSRQAWFAFDAATNTNFYRQEPGSLSTINATFGQGMFDTSFSSPNYQTQILNNLSGTNGAQEVFFDGVSVHTDNNTNTGAAISGLHLGIQNVGTKGLDGKYQEFILYDTVKSSANRTSIESNIGDYFTQNTPLLDTYSGAAAAYSLRLLDSSYVGSAIRVRRSSDNAEQDIGFNVFGELDTVSLLAFAGTGSAYVKVWYCQSGNSNDATQTDTARQPQIVSSGVVEVENGKPILVSLGGSTGLINTVAGSTTQYSSAVMKHRGSGSSMFLSSGGSWILPASIGSSVSSSAQGATVSNLYLNGSVYSYTTWGAWATATGSQSLTTLLANNSTFSNADFGLTASTGYGMYSTQEVVIWNSDQSSNRTGIETNVNTFYNIF